MSIDSLSLISFRNHNNTYFEFSEGVTVIWGENGSGKTSVLEAIHLLTYGKSFKTHKQTQFDSCITEVEIYGCICVSFTETKTNI